MCDKIIDCLDGEDEYNCDVTQSSKTNTVSGKLTNKVNMSQNYNEISANKNILNDNDIDFSIPVTKPTTSNLEDEETINHFTTEISSNYIEYTNTLSSEIQTAELNTKSDELEEGLKYTSTEKVSNVNYSQENENNVSVGDNYTVNPINVTTLLNEELVQKSITLNNSKYPIGSMSFTLESSTMQNNDVFNQENNELTTTEIDLDNFLQTSTHDNTNVNFDSDIGQSSNKLIKSLSNSDLVLENLNETNTNSYIAQIIDQVSSESTSVEHSHNIRQLDTRGEIINDVEKIMFSEFQPAKKRKKDLASKDFKCSR